MKAKFGRILYWIVFLIFSILFISNLIFFIKVEISKTRDTEVYEEITSKVAESKTESSVPASDSNSNNSDNEVDEVIAPSILPEYEELYAENSDLYGWIKIDNTLIDFPVMYTPNEPEFYLRKNFAKEYSIAGTPFILEPNVDNTIIFGHNMEDTRMFSTLSKYKDIEYWKEHKYIQFNTLYEKRLYEIFIVTNAKVYYSPENVPNDAYLFYAHINFTSDKDFDDYIVNAKTQQYFDSGISSSYGDSLITLCTCDYVYSDARLLIIAKKCDA